MRETTDPVVSSIKGENIRPEIELNIGESEISLGEKSYYAYQKVFSTLTPADIPSSNFSHNNKIFIEELE